METMVNFGSTSDCQYHPSSSLSKLLNTFHHGVDMFQNTFWKARRFLFLFT